MATTSSFFLFFFLPFFLLSFFHGVQCSVFELEELSWLDEKDDEVDMVQSRHNSLRSCDFRSGKWVYDQSYPLYDDSSCPYLSSAVACQKNGRPDSDYEKWRWKPHGCSIPRFDALEFLGRMRRKRIMLVGDSIMRNQWESLVCLIQSVIPNDRKSVTYAGPSMAFHALDYEASVEFCWAPFLVELKKENGNKRILHLDLIEENAKYWRGIDVLVFDSAHWWTHSDRYSSWDFIMEGNSVLRTLNRMVAYQKGLTTWAKWVDLNLDPRSTQVIFPSMSPSTTGITPLVHMLLHWIVHMMLIMNFLFFSVYRQNGLKCYNQREPLGNASHTHVPELVQVLQGELRRMSFPVYLQDVTAMSALRKDGHPSVYARAMGQEEKQHLRDYTSDCSHWCLPGVPDIWNEMLSTLI